jgi:two-component system, NarL family, sensor kinase
MLQRNTLLLLFYFLFLLPCCKNKKDAESAIYEAPSKEQLDRYCTYLEKPENFFESKYMPFFYQRFNQLLNENKLDSAAQILAITGKTYDKNYKIDKKLLQISLSFLSKHSSTISKRYYGRINRNIGNMYYMMGDFDSCTVFLKKALVVATDYYTYTNNAETKYYLLFSYLNNGKLDQSLTAGFEALKMFENLKDTSFQGSVNSGIACIYSFEDNYNEALIYEQKGFELVKQTKDTDAVFVAALNKINLYNTIEHANLVPFIDSTFAFYNKWSKRDLPRNRLSMDSWYALMLVENNKLSEAKAILDKIKLILSTTDDEVGKDYFYNALTEYEVKIGKGSDNVGFYKKRIPELKKYEDYLRLQLYYMILHDDAVVKKDFKAALNYQEQVNVAADSLNNRHLRTKVAELDKKYQTEKKEQQIDLQKSEITQKNTYIALLIASLTGLLLATFAYYSWKRQKNLKQEKTNSMNFTKQLLENTEDERKRIASDLHDSISHELLNLKSIFKQDLTTVNNKIDTIINDIRGISRNLHPVMFDKIGLVPNIEQLVERTQTQNDFLVSTDIAYTGTLTSADELQIYRIIQEALTNIIKYAKAHAAKITILEKIDKITIEIKDNGKGFHVKEMLNSGKAFGLHNIIERSRVIGGEAQIQSSAEGTIININIPKKV